MIDLILYSKPFDWNDNLSEEAIEDFETIRGKLTYCQHQSIGMALAKLELLEKQGCKVIDPSVSSSEKPNKCEDAISRRMVLDATVNKNSIWNNITNAKGENLEEIISQLPPINQMNKWIGAEVLDDIKAEIENKYESISDTFHHYETGFTDALEWALSLIDKHIEESEGKNEVN